MAKLSRSLSLSLPLTLFIYCSNLKAARILKQCTDVNDNKRAANKQAPLTAVPMSFVSYQIMFSSLRRLMERCDEVNAQNTT